MNFDLPMKPPMEEVDIVMVDRQPTMTKAIELCQSISGLEDKIFIGPKGIVPDATTWSRIKSGQGRFFPQDQYTKYMDINGNEVPLIWLARRRGYHLVPMETELEQRLRVERERGDKLAAENALLRDLVRGRAT